MVRDSHSALYVTHGTATAILYVCPSVRQTRALLHNENEIVVCQYINTVR